MRPLERPHRYVVVAVDPAVRGMSRLADELEAAPCLPTPAALRQRIALTRADARDDGGFGLVAAVLPSTHPELVIRAALAGVERIAVYHPGPVSLSKAKESLLRAIFALVDLTVVADAAAERSAVALGADPERIADRTAAVSDRLFGEPPRRPRRAAWIEAAASLALDAGASAGLLALLERATPDRGVNVVNYHRVLPLEELITYGRPQMALAAPLFEAQLETMAKERGFAPVERLREADAEGRVAITFDDGYEDNFRVALPILERFSAPACIYLVTGLIDRPEALWWDRVGLGLFAYWKGGASAPIPEALPASAKGLRQTTSFERARWIISGVLSELNQLSTEAREAAADAAEALVGAATRQRTMLAWSEVEAMARAGIVFGAHTRSHVPLDELTLEEAKAEIFGSQQDLEAHVGTPAVRTAARPRGRRGPLGEADLAAHFGAVMTTDPGVNAPASEQLFLHRRDGRMLTLAGRHHPAKLRLELTGVVDRLRAAWNARRGSS